MKEPKPVTAMGGAVRYHPKTAGVETVPNEPNNPLSNPLLPLNPSEAPPIENTVSGLPPLSSAPAPKLAVPNPKYQQPSDDTPQGSSTYRRRMKPASSAPDAKRYTVEPDDTYMTISSRFYDTSLLYHALAVHNSRLGAAWMPEPGTEIEIPSAEYLQSHYPRSLSRTGERSGLSTNGDRRIPSPVVAVTSVTSTARPGTRYIVKPGDTVFKIAEEKLKDTGRWRDIIQWNSDQLQDARDLRPGMEIILPGAASARIQ